MHTMDEHARARFAGIERLYEQGAVARLLQRHVAVVGLGGVGSWVAEALARSGVGTLTLIDLDHIAESNVNRQVHALGRTLGQAKVEAMAERIRDINPQCTLHLVDDYRGQGVAAGSKSLTFALRFRAADRTLTAAEASEAKLAGARLAAERFGAAIRD